MRRTLAAQRQIPEWKTTPPFSKRLGTRKEAKAKGWSVVNMKEDWRTIFPSTR